MACSRLEDSCLLIAPGSLLYRACFLERTADPKLLDSPFSRTVVAQIIHVGTFHDHVHMARLCSFPKSGKDGFFADIAAVRRILTEPRDVEFVDLAYLLANVIFLAEILRFFQFSVGERAWTCGNGHSFVTKCFLCSFQQKCGVHSTGKATATLPRERRISWSFLYFFSSVMLSVAGICSVTS